MSENNPTEPSSARARTRQDEHDIARRARFFERTALFGWIFVAWAAFAFWVYTLVLDARAHFESLLTNTFKE